ncbi:hypothetical protein ACFVHW_16730 [Streptomyces sp. NPDC127110]|uniref:hypothetical protein n=1 Tax=Streptomyces sp. NPDC127110 TaxID=3345362 RepID=UPI003642F721
MESMHRSSSFSRTPMMVLPLRTTEKTRHLAMKSALRAAMVAWSAMSVAPQVPSITIAPAAVRAGAGAAWAGAGHREQGAGGDGHHERALGAPHQGGNHFSP